MALDQVTQSQAQHDVTVNDNFYAVQPSKLFGWHGSASSGLSWAYYGGPFTVGGVPTLIADGAITLTDNATNYIYATSSGVVTKTTSFDSSWPGPIVPGATALYEVVTLGGFVQSKIDYRTPGFGGGGGGGGTGPQGPQGSQGAQGTQGNQGAQGATGSGTQGSQGTQGTAGAQGPQGFQGTQGNQGTSGFSGIDGLDGTSGSQGAQGFTGAQGSQGTQGNQGNQGTTGGTGPASPRQVPRTITVAYASTVSFDADNYDVFTVNTQTGIMTIGFAGSPTHGQAFRVAIKQDAIGGWTITFDTSIRTGTDLSTFTTSAASKWDYLAFIYNGIDSKFDFVSLSRGYS